MAMFDELVGRARLSLKSAIAEIELDTTNPGFAIADVALGVMEELVPEPVTAPWCISMLGERPELIDEAADGDTLGNAVRSAVIETILSALDDEMQEYADSLGITEGGAPHP